MDKQRFAYVVVTAVFALGLLPGAVMDIIHPQILVEVAARMELPLHLMTLIGIWKLLGVFAMARPGWRRINEWAYAGFFFDLTGAAVLHAAVGDWAGVPVPLAFVGLLFASYTLRDRALAAAEEGSSTAAHAVVAPA